MEYPRTTAGFLAKTGNAYHRHLHFLAVLMEDPLVETFDLPDLMVITESLVGEFQFDGSYCDVLVDMVERSVTLPLPPTKTWDVEIPALVEKLRELGEETCRKLFNILVYRNLPGDGNERAERNFQKGMKAAFGIE